jgi:hypothetical protein
MLPGAVAQARNQGLNWEEIGQLLRVSAATAARRYRKCTMINLTRITGISPRSAQARTCV